MWKPFIKLIKVLSSNTDPGSVAAGFGTGILLGFMPKDNLMWYILSIFILFLYIQRSAFLIGMLIGSLFAPLLDPTFHQIGTIILTNETLIPFFSKALEVPFVSLIKFNNTIVMGSFIFSVVIYIPLFYLIKILVLLWRKFIAPSIQKLHVVNAMKKISLFSKIKDAVSVNK